MSDLIYRQAAIDALNKEIIKRRLLDDVNDGMLDEFDTEDILRKLPPAQPEIIRCKDCKHRYVEDMIWHCPFGLMGGENFFCGYGSLGTVEGRRNG